MTISGLSSGVPKVSVALPSSWRRTSMLAAVRVVPTVAAAAVAGQLLPRPRDSAEAGSWVSSQHPSRSASPVRPPASPDAATWTALRLSISSKRAAALEPRRRAATAGGRPGPAAGPSPAGSADVADNAKKNNSTKHHQKSGGADQGRHGTTKELGRPRREFRDNGRTNSLKKAPNVCRSI